MRPISDFFPRVLPYVPGCPQPVAEQAILDAAIVFCEDSLVIRERFSAFNTDPGIADYGLTTPSDTQVARLLAVYVNGTQIPAWVSDPPPPAVGSGAPTTYYTTRSDGVFKLELYPIPDRAYEITVEAALRPTRDAATLDSDLFGLWSDAVVSGAIGRLSSIPDQPFSDLARAGAAQLTAAFMGRKARTENGVGRVKGVSRVAQRPLA